MSKITSKELRRVSWSKDYLWEIHFPSAPNPPGSPDTFSEWFPAETVSQNTWSIETRTIASLYSIGGLSSPFQLDITFLDDLNQTLSDWLRDIVNNRMLPSNGRGRKFLDDYALPVLIKKFDNEGETISTEGMWVFPTGSFNFEGSNQSASSSKAVQFIIVGKY